MAIKFMITDFDGTLVSTFEANFEAYRRALAVFDIQLSRCYYKSVFGLRWDGWIPDLMKSFSAADITHLREEKAGQAKLLADQTQVNVPLLQFLRSQKSSISLALATTASRSTVMNILALHGIVDLFEVIVCGEDVQTGKPDPECYQKAMTVLKAKPEECLIFEDSEVGIAAATASGAVVFRVTSWESQ